MAGINQLQNLIDLAKEPSSERRRELLREVTDIFLEAPESLNQTEAEHFEEILGKVAFGLEMEIRQELSQKLSASDAAPAGLITKLANDEIEVAKPVLMNSNILKDSDLCDIIKRHSQDHLLAVSMREKISEEVSQSLVENGNDHVVGSLLRNEGAMISKTAMQAVVKRSENNEELHKPIIDRKDIPADLMKEMYSRVSSALRDHILATVDNIDPSLIDEVLEKSRSQFDAQIPPDTDWNAPAEYIDRMERLNELNQGLLVQLLRQSKIPEFIIGFAKFLDIDRRLAQQIIFEKGYEALAITCKAIGFNRSTVSTLIQLTHDRRSDDDCDVDGLLAMYDKISSEDAQRALRFWRTRQKFSKVK